MSWVTKLMGTKEAEPMSGDEAVRLAMALIDRVCDEQTRAECHARQEEVRAIRKRTGT